MSEVIPFPQPIQALHSLEELVQKVHEFAKTSDNVWIDCPHIKERMNQRNVTTRQIFDVLRKGRGIDGPTLDKFGDFRIKLKKYSAGRDVQAVVVVKESHVEVITVI